MRRIAIILAAAAACALASAGDGCRSRHAAEPAEPAERDLPHQLPGHNPVPGHITHGRRTDPAAGPGADMGDDAGPGFVPPAGAPNSPASTSLLNSSAVVPSKAVVSRSCQVAPVPRPTSARAACSSNARRATCSPGSALAFDSAGPARTGVPGLRSGPGMPKVMRKISSWPSPGNRHPARTQQGRRRVQRPVPLVAARRGGHRLIGNPLGQELSGQAAAVDLLKPAQPQAQAGHDPAGQTRLQAGLLILGSGSGHGQRGRHDIAKWRDNEAPVPGRSWLEHLTSCQELCFSVLSRPPAAL
jgi:hypothetical protein